MKRVAIDKEAAEVQAMLIKQMYELYKTLAPAMPKQSFGPEYQAYTDFHDRFLTGLCAQILTFSKNVGGPHWKALINSVILTLQATVDDEAVTYETAIPKNN